jgi:hypothetical protein
VHGVPGCGEGREEEKMSGMEDTTTPEPLDALRAVVAEVADELERRDVHQDLADRLHGAVDAADSEE